MTENETFLLVYLIGIPLFFCAVMAATLAGPGQVDSRRVWSIVFASLVWPFTFFWWILP